jgi:predicted MFS family arabinose efflux permease
MIMKRSLIIFSSLISLYFFALVHRIGIAVIAIDMMKEFSVDASLIGLMSSMYFFPYAIAQIPVGIMLDRIGVRKTIVILSSIACIGSLIFSLSPSLELVSLGRAMIGFGVGGYYVSGYKAISIWFDQRKFATLTGTFTSLGNLGAIFATFPLAIITLYIGWRYSFLLITIIMIILTVLAWISIEEYKSKEFYSERNIISDLKIVFSHREFLLLSIIPFLAYGLTLSFQGLWGGPFLADVYNMDKSTVGFLLLFISIGFIISSSLSGYISDKIRKRKPNLIFGVTINAIIWITLSIFGNKLNILLIAILLFLLGFSYGFFNVYMVISKELFTSDISGTGIASLNLFNFIGAGFFQYVMGIIISERNFSSYQNYFIIASILMLIAIIPALKIKESYKT